MFDVSGVNSSKPNRLFPGLPYHLRMKQFLTTVPRNLIDCFKGRRIVWHIVAILLTFILVMSGFDWSWFLATRNPALRSWMWPAVGIGGLLSLALPRHSRNSTSEFGFKFVFLQPDVNKWIAQ
jgi:hypothetical protein